MMRAGISANALGTAARQALAGTGRPPPPPASRRRPQAAAVRHTCAVLAPLVLPIALQLVICLRRLLCSPACGT